MSAETGVRLEVVNTVATITLARPTVGNAINLALAQGFATAVAALDPAQLRLVVLAADGPMFCVGGDVREMSAAPDRAGFVAELAAIMHKALISLRALPIPVLAVVGGPAAGGGLGLVLAADIVLAASSAQFVSAYAGVGLTPDCGVSALLPKAVGARRAALFLLTARALGAAEALEWGLVSQVCEPERLPARAAELIAGFAAAPPGALGEAARLLRTAPDRPYAAQLVDEAVTIARLSAQPEAGQLLNAFVERQNAKAAS
jgi:2-(1,2-epoxy-1,2-dihydrophenyl)acetyl-CoA isomerase